MTKEKSDVHAMAEQLGIKKENLELGLKKDRKSMETMVQKAYDFKFKKR